MDMFPVIIFLVIALPLLGFLAWMVLQDAFIRINAGQIGLVITRGKPAAEGIPPGTHFALRFGRVIEIYPSVELTYLAGANGQIGEASNGDLTCSSPPLRVPFGNRAVATVQYTVRFAVTSPGLPTIHTRFGTDGMWGIVRDESRRVIIEILNDEEVTTASGFGAARIALEVRLTEAMTKRLAECGFALAMFNLREVHLEGISEVIQSTQQAAEELALEEATASVRLARARHDAEIDAELAGSLSNQALRYREIEVWRELVSRWNGNLLLLPDRSLLGPLGGATKALEPPPTESTANES